MTSERLKGGAAQASYLSGIASEEGRAFRNALGAFPTGVIVVTAAFGDKRVGLTIGSFTSLSLQPRLVMFSVACGAKSLPWLLKARQYGINVLRNDQQAMSVQFANAHHDKWANVALRTGPTGCLLLADALAAFECIPHATYEGGDHVILVGEVTHFESDGTADPLVFYRGRYAQLAS